MFKKIMAALMCITMAAAFVGCGSDKDSSSKSESSATEAVTEESLSAGDMARTDSDAEKAESEIEEAQKEAQEAELAEENQIDSADEAAEQSMDSEEVKEILLDGKWQSGYITDAEGNIYTINDYSEALGTDPSTFDMQMEFAEDGTVKVNSASDGEETGTYTVDGIIITMTDDADGSELMLVYDEENEMLFVDLLGTGELLIGFTIE